MIQDIKPVGRERMLNAIEEQQAIDAWEKETIISAASNERLIQELYDRGVPHLQIYAQYYEMEEASNGRLMTVEDALLAGVTGFDPREGF